MSGVHLLRSFCLGAGLSAWVIAIIQPMPPWFYVWAGANTIGFAIGQYLVSKKG